MLKRIGTGRLVTRSLGDAAVPCTVLRCCTGELNPATGCSVTILLLQPQVTARLINEAFGDVDEANAAARLLLAAGVAP